MYRSHDTRRFLWKGREQEEDIRYRHDLSELMEEDEEGASIRVSTITTSIQDLSREVMGSEVSTRDDEDIVTTKSHDRTVSDQSDISTPGEAVEEYRMPCEKGHDVSFTTKYLRMNTGPDMYLPFDQDTALSTVDSNQSHDFLSEGLDNASPLIAATTSTIGVSISKDVRCHDLSHHHVSLDSFTRDLPSDPHGHLSQWDGETTSSLRSGRASISTSSALSDDTVMPPHNDTAEVSTTITDPTTHPCRESMEWDRLKDFDFQAIETGDVPSRVSNLIRKSRMITKSLDILNGPKSFRLSSEPIHLNNTRPTLRQRLRHGIPSFTPPSIEDGDVIHPTGPSSNHLSHLVDVHYHNINPRLRVRVEMTTEYREDNGDWISVPTTTVQSVDSRE